MKHVFRISLSLLLLPLSLLIQTQVSAEGYVIAPGDSLRLLLLEYPEYNQMLYVEEDGKIPYFYGDIHAAGKTTDEVIEELRARLSNVIPNPVIVVSPIPKGTEIFVSGQVKVPNRYPFAIHRQPNLSQALAMAGGVIKKSADLSNVQVIRSDGKLEVYDLEDELENMRVHAKIYLYSGDMVYIPPLSLIEVKGNVQQPGSFWIKEEVSVDHALAMAGGPLQRIADLANLIIYRANGDKVKISVTDEFWGGETNTAEYTLSDGDILYVPNAYKTERVNVLGYVQKPGGYQVRGPITPLEALALAGGARVEVADITKVKIRKIDGSVQFVDITKYYTEIQAPPDIKLYPGDTLEVGKRFQLNWSLLLSLLSLASVTIVSIAGR